MSWICLTLRKNVYERSFACLHTTINLLTFEVVRSHILRSRNVSSKKKKLTIFRKWKRVGVGVEEAENNVKREGDISHNFKFSVIIVRPKNERLESSESDFTWMSFHVHHAIFFIYLFEFCFFFPFNKSSSNYILRVNQEFAPNSIPFPVRNATMSKKIRGCVRIRQNFNLNNNFIPFKMQLCDCRVPQNVQKTQIAFLWMLISESKVQEGKST